MRSAAWDGPATTDGSPLSLEPLSHPCLTQGEREDLVVTVPRQPTCRNSLVFEQNTSSSPDHGFPPLTKWLDKRDPSGKRVGHSKPSAVPGPPPTLYDAPYLPDAAVRYEPPRFLPRKRVEYCHPYYDFTTTINTTCNLCIRLPRSRIQPSTHPIVASRRICSFASSISRIPFTVARTQPKPRGSDSTDFGATSLAQWDEATPPPGLGAGPSMSTALGGGKATLTSSPHPVVTTTSSSSAAESRGQR